MTFAPNVFTATNTSTDIVLLLKKTLTDLNIRITKDFTIVLRIFDQFQQSGVKIAIYTRPVSFSVKVVLLYF